MNCHFYININFTVELHNEDDNIFSDNDVRKLSQFIRWNNVNVMSFKDNINLEDLRALETELDRLLKSNDVENKK